jgi:hypothetical protein
MSRILRRPMFRGGRVDGRGTGITSGLSYAKGGSVNIPKRGLVDGPGGYAGEYGIFSQQVQPKDYRQKQQFYQQEYKPLYPTFESIADAYNKAVKNEEANIDAMEIEQLFPASNTKRYDDLYDLTSPGGKAEFFQEKRNEEKARLDEASKYGVDLTTQLEKAIKKDTPVLNANVNTNTGTGEPSSDDLLDIDKEKFAKLLGSDKARGEDISNMLMSFAGKALKPEATVKGAFGEFFEEEAKRPSSKTKVDQAAAQLAINKYIKGEISKAELAKLVAMNSMKTNLGDRAYIADQFKTSTSFSNAVKDGIQRNPQRRGQSIRFKEVTSDQMLPENFKPGPEDIGIIFIETDTQTAYEYDNNLQRIEIYSR